MDQKVSVIIPTADRPDSLKCALASLRAQDATNLEVVVVNDGGGDVREVLAPFKDAFGITLLSHDDNRGPSAARNAAMDAAGGDFVMFLDDDDVVLPGHLATVLKVLDEDIADVVYPTLRVSTTRHEPTDEGYRDALPAFDYDFDIDLLLMANYIPPTGLTMRVPRSGGPRFDKDIRFAEDWDLWLRMHAEGYRFHHADIASVVYHRLPRHDHKADPAASESRAIHAFHEGYNYLCERWAVAPDSAAARGRALVQEAYRMAFVQLDRHHKLVAPYWWENMLRVLYRQHNGMLSGADIEAELQRAVTG